MNTMSIINLSLNRKIVDGYKTAVFSLWFTPNTKGMWQEPRAASSSTGLKTFYPEVRVVSVAIVDWNR